ncbi:hypothetical protein [Halorussus caseinilyticus]|uniref:Lipoprotein n=1 Tax=Halorussus caseinilyticus TaxID=3034025 RepID=A0ABD5WM50_9EURY|nr:hypothetical protein [Halorussus sp. DT72]
MKRRPFLHLAVGAAAATAGCLGRFDTDARPADATVSPTATTRMAAADESGDDAALSVAGVETFDYVVRLNDLGDDPGGGVTAFSDLTDRQREVVATAIDGTYRTRDPAMWLRKFASGTPFVERDATYYRLEDTFPTYRVTAKSAAESDVSGEVASYDEYERAVTHDGYVTSGLLGIARREGIELSYVWPSLREFFETYDAVRYHGEVVSFSVEVTDSGPPYEMSATEVPVSKAVGGSVWNASAESERTRRLVRRAGRARGAYGFDRAPAGLLAALRSHEYVRLDDTFYTTYVEKRDPVPVSVSAEVRDGRLRLALRNDGDADVRLSSGVPRPFGVVRCRPADAPDSSAHRLLWTDAYADSDHVRTDGRRIASVNDLALVSTLGPGESVAETYAVPADLPPGEYAVESSLGVRSDGGDGESDGESDGSSTVRYRVTFSVA